ncbi:hypothetical protein SCLCIDRAFT_1217415 [Scleroderma citrinum Foug A]|uniref:Uncharacterized protein n=1 Tax=Scleroderma citrinum Foug A TaxID=1036808 RepID=A0A0C3DUD7_9AGAM|nr:hypothetical protein SCLCIDRAFT_1217415 [Scleroderma citrinum Foug A]
MSKNASTISTCSDLDHYLNTFPDFCGRDDLFSCFPMEAMVHITAYPLGILVDA